MKETIKTSRTAGYLEKVFRAINADWFGGELEEPIITIQSTPRAYGHVTVSKIWKRKGEQRQHRRESTPTSGGQEQHREDAPTGAAVTTFPSVFPEGVSGPGY